MPRRLCFYPCVPMCSPAFPKKLRWLDSIAGLMAPGLDTGMPRFRKPSGLLLRPGSNLTMRSHGIHILYIQRR